MLPGDKIFGFVTIADGIKVHNDQCPNAINLRAQYDYRVIQAKWVNEERFKNQTTLDIEGIDRLGILNDVTKTINSMGLDVKSINLSSNDGIIRGEMIIEMKNRHQLEEAISLLEKIEGVIKVTRG